MSDPVKVFWVEPSGNKRVTQTRAGVEEWSKRCTAAEAEELSQLPLPSEPNSWRCCENLFLMPDGTEVADRDLPPGALRDNKYFHEIAEWCGPDGLSLVLKLPNGHDWNIDSQAKNCTKPDDKIHRCWCRHGDLKTGMIHVDKDGNTCNAGAGSILSGDWHGHLIHGFLVQC